MKQYKFQEEGLLDKIVSPIRVDVSDYETKVGSNDTYYNAKALWDTGSTVTVISSLMVEQLGLIATDITTVRGFQGQPVKANTYNIDLWLDNIHIEYIQAIEGSLTNIDMILDRMYYAKEQCTSHTLTTKHFWFLRKSRIQGYA